MGESISSTLGRIAGSTDPLPARGAKLLAALRTTVPFDAAWLGSAEVDGTGCVSLASIDLTDDVVHHLTRRAPAGRPDRRGPPDSSGSELRSSSPSDRLDVLGYRASLIVDLFVRGGRHVGVLVLLHRRGAPPAHTTRRRLEQLSPLLALGIDPMRCLVATARTVQDVRAGTVLHDDGSTEPLPGLASDPLVEVGSAPLAIARSHLAEGLSHASFLWPLGGSYAPDGHARITVVAAAEDLPAAFVGMALISPVGDLCGLTPRELEVMGLVIDGRANREIARTLVVSPRTVAAHIEHLLAKLDASSRTQAAVRAERAGLYVPAGRGPRVGCSPRTVGGAGHAVALRGLGRPGAGPVRCSPAVKP